MTRIAYVNGAYCSIDNAKVSIEDRGYQFADGVYEVVTFINKRFIDEVPHMARLRRSLATLQIDFSVTDAALHSIFQQLVRKNRRDSGLVYLQITRGVAKRDHPFPKAVNPSLVATVYPLKLPTAMQIEQGAAAITQPDIRWGHCDVKSIGLLPNCMAKQQAVQAGVREAILVNARGEVTEGSATNVFIVKDGALITHPANNYILGGVRRDAVLRFAQEQEITVQERAPMLEELRSADECFISSASSFVLPITTIDGVKVGAGIPGVISMRMLAAYRAHVSAQVGVVL